MPLSLIVNTLPILLESGKVIWVIFTSWTYKTSTEQKRDFMEKKFVNVYHIYELS